MCDIYLAKSVGVDGFHKPVVIKKLLPRYVSKPRYVRRFVNEGRTLSRLNHANIVQILDMGMISGEYYIALEYIEGRNAAYILAKSARTGRHISLDFAMYVTLEVAKGLAYSHRRKSPAGEPLLLVHQDINSFNVMVSYEAEVKIIDFGIARMFLESEPVEGLPVAGKLLYFSPEQLQRKTVDRRVDIYGVGVLLYELVTGERLVDHQETVKATVKSILEMDIRQKVESNPKIPKALHPVLIKAMALDPEDRYPWMEGMIADLRALIKNLSLDMDSTAFSKYMKEQFRREILLDRQRMRKLLAEGLTDITRTQDVGAGNESVEAWRTLDLVTAAVQASPSVSRSETGQDHGATEQIVCFPAGKTIYECGDPADRVYVIQKGKIRTFLAAGDKRQTLDFIGQGALFGETALLAGTSRIESAIAEEDTHVIALDRESFTQLVGPDIAGKVVISLVEKLASAEILIEGSLFQDMLSRLIHALITCHRTALAGNDDAIPIARLTGAFGLEDEDRVRKYLSKLEELEIVKTGEDDVRVRDMERLDNLLSLLTKPGKLRLKL
ncbi:MAG: protein kinase [Desulfomonile tiedjei]|nr:protein kinase [Desulfomonile tiedjei]